MDSVDITVGMVLDNLPLALHHLLEQDLVANEAFVYVDSLGSGTLHEISKGVC